MFQSAAIHGSQDTRALPAHPTGCESKNPVAWKFGEALPSSAKTFPIPEPLLGKLSFYPGYQFVRLGIDVLALEKDSGKVADAVLNLGKAN